MINGVENIEIYGCLLEYCSNPEEIEITTNFFNEIKYDGDDKVIIQCLGPVIFRIVRQIMSKESRQFVKRNLNLMILMIDVEKITKDLIDYCDNFLPIADKYLKYVDVQAEMISIFATNYVYGLIERLEKIDIKLIRELKLQQLKKL